MDNERVKVVRADKPLTKADLDFTIRKKSNVAVTVVRIIVFLNLFALAGNIYLLNFLGAIINLVFVSVLLLSDGIREEVFDKTYVVTTDEEELEVSVSFLMFNHEEIKREIARALRDRKEDNHDEVVEKEITINDLEEPYEDGAILLNDDWQEEIENNEEYEKQIFFEHNVDDKTYDSPPRKAIEEFEWLNKARNNKGE